MESCSRCRGIRVHDPVETLFTIAWNTQYYLPTNRATLDDVKKSIDMAALRARFAPYFKDDAQNGAPYMDLDGLIKVTFEEIQPR